MLDCWNSDQSHTSDHETNQANCTGWTIQAFFKFSICSEEHPNIEEPSHNGEHHGDDLGNHGSPILDGEELAEILTVCADHDDDKYAPHLTALCQLLVDIIGASIQELQIYAENQC